MKATELRIGNYVDYYEDDTYYSIIRVLAENICHLNNASSIEYEDIKPILLTEELLLKCGFFIVETNGSVNATMPKLRYELNKIKKSNIYLFCDKDVILIEIVYLHQLQNIFFALTNQELKIKL